MRTKVLLTALLVAAAAVAGCSQRAPGGGSGEGLTVLCSAQEDWCQKVTAAFAAKTGITTRFVRLSAGEALARVDAAKGSPEFDVWHGGPADTYVAAQERGLLQPHTSEITERIPAQFRDPAGYWTGIYFGALGFCSNPDVLQANGLQVPTSWNDLLAPGFTKQVGIAHPATSGTAYTALWTMVTLTGSEAGGLDYFRKLHRSVLQYSKTGSGPGQQAARGEVATAIVFSHDCAKYKKESAPNLVLSFPEEGTGYEIGGVGILAGAHNLDAAREYVDFAASAEAQNIGPTVNSFQRPTAPDATAAPESFDPETTKLVDYDLVAAGKAKEALLKQFSSDVANSPEK
ncbi:iron(III) transport system substrate-binding protein [Pseudonocardia thermophila]|jgi:ABC-type Fe3+ transport system, periplasmic component|uniref:Iron(III) transport system substrate-binding protein n=1 Tax=Pseudonocardia thermophila TaxID=1848 RepID=A0A1M6ZVG4_PSETH|nr:ABC transporter substrate-binding protein [Pseudonocardia thermophila]SHL34345.1 iron(III) transport system substrate-binding protein [Pseudonocardia thermophila]